MKIGDPVQVKAHTDIKGVIDLGAMHPGGSVWRINDQWFQETKLEEADEG